MKMNTPTAIFLGLALIAVAIFFRQPSISEAKAQLSNSYLVMTNNALDDIAKAIGRIKACRN